MLSEGLQPNLVTYNTLLEVYAKRGMWREAVGVLDTLEQQVNCTVVSSTHQARRSNLHSILHHNPRMTSTTLLGPLGLLATNIVLVSALSLACSDLCQSLVHSTLS